MLNLIVAIHKEHSGRQLVSCKQLELNTHSVLRAHVKLLEFIIKKEKI